MEWSDEGFVLGARRLGEANVILEALTREHGRHLGVVRGGRSARNHPVLQPGNSVSLTWRARLDEHLGTYAVEAVNLRAARFMPSALALNLLGCLTALTRLLPERDPHPELFDHVMLLAEHLDQDQLGPALMVRYELAILSELGFGLDLTRCAATGGDADLIYVSPKSGRAVSAAAGEPYKERLLALPSFLGPSFGRDMPHAHDVLCGFALTGFFLARHVYEPRGLAPPDGRARVVEIVRAQARGV